MKPQTPKTIAQGAEAIITLAPAPKNSPHKSIIIKNRIQKSYRLPKLDEKIRRQRTKSESKILEKAGKIINTPQVLKTEKFQIQMSFIPGERLSETLNNKSKKEQIQIIQQIAEQIAKLHDNNIIHGDLTTSNTVLSIENTPNPEDTIKQQTLTNNNIKDKQIRTSINYFKSDASRPNNKSEAPILPKAQIYIIDFGLSFISHRIEDKAVDLHLIKQALEAKHFQNHQELFNAFIKSYNPKEKINILERLKKVEARGRYKHSCE